MKRIKKTQAKNKVPRARLAAASSSRGAANIPGFEQEQSPFDWRSDEGDTREPLLRRMVRQQAAAAGLTGGDKTARIAGRVSPTLLAAAREKSGILSDTELIEYALSKVALEDDFGKWLVAQKGSIPKDFEF